MNVIPATLSAEGRLDISSAGFAIGGVDISSQAVRAYSGKKVLVGIRPENIQKARGEHVDTFDAHVDVAEPTGPDTLAFFRLGETEVVARLQPRSVVSGARVRLAIDASKVVLFDPETELRIK
jgi:multiple sugar transport system ATP-binding protein